jgi:hypothetical protein
VVAKKPTAASFVGPAIVGMVFDMPILKSRSDWRRLRRMNKSSFLERLPLPTGFPDPLEDDPDKGPCMWCGKDARWKVALGFECDDCDGTILGDPCGDSE